MKLSLAIAGLLGLTLAIGLIGFYGAGDIGLALLGVGWGALLLIAFHLLQMLFSGLGWQSLVPQAVRPRLLPLIGIRWIREAVNNLLPVAQIGGEFVGARLLRLAGVPLGTGGASVTVDLTMEMVSQILFTLVGLALLLPGLEDASLVHWLLGGLFVAAAAAACFVLAQRRGIFRLIERGLLLFGERTGWAALGECAGLDEAIQDLYRQPGRLALGGSWHFISWLLGGFEVMLALHLLGIEIDFRDGLVIESLGQALRTVGFAVPGALGVQEGGYVLVCGALGIAPQTAIELSLLKRMRELALGVPALLVWQAIEGNRLLHRFGSRILPLSGTGD